MHLLLNTFSLSFTFLFRIKWDNLCWQNNKCVSIVPVCYSWPCPQLNPLTSKTSHTPHSNKTTPELSAQGTAALEKEHWLHGSKATPWPQPFHSHFLSAGLDGLKGAGESDCYTTTESSSLIPIPVSFQSCNTDARMFTGLTFTCTKATDRATTKPCHPSPLLVILLTEQCL